jgi:hypothetical protein
VWSWAAILALLVGCGSTSDITIDLRDVNGDCATAFASVNAISIEVVAANGRCRLKHECASTPLPPNDLSKAQQALRDTADVLVEIVDGDGLVLVINGRPKKSCFPSEVEMNDPILCGYMPLKSARNGALVIELGPSSTATETGLCPESMPLCP